MKLPLALAHVEPASAVVLVNRRCNQACRFCDGRGDSDGEEHRDPIVREAIVRAAKSGAVTISGGEPALRSELPAWIALARQSGARVTVETNATIFAYRERARAVADAGLAAARVALAAGDDEAAALITRDEGGLARALDGIGELTAAGVDVAVTIPLTDASLPSLSQLISRAASSVRRPGKLIGFFAHVLRSEPLDLARAARAVSDAARIAAALPDGGVRFAFDPDRALPPCAFAEIDPPARLLEGIQGSPIAACSSCAIDRICHGPSPVIPSTQITPLDGNAARRVAPALDDRARAALLDAVSTFHYFDTERAAIAQGITLRILYGCNQRCPMCFVDTSLDAVSPTLWREALREAGARGVRYLQLSGGEPTLSPHLLEAIALARTSGITRIELQTNALRCSDSQFTNNVKEAGLTHALVSLHGASDAIADAVTDAEGTAERTRIGVDNLLDSGISVRLHFVVNGLNHREALPFVEGVLARWGTRVSLLFSFVAPMDRVPKASWLVPRMSEIAPSLASALDRCIDAGLEFCGPASFCGLPLCILDGARHYPDRHPIPDGSVSSEFVRAEACDGCRERPFCRGVRAAYADLHGTAELTRR